MEEQYHVLIATCEYGLTHNLRDKYGWLQLAMQLQDFASVQNSSLDFTSFCSFHFNPVAIETVTDVLNLLMVTKDTGPGGLPAHILKLAALVIAGTQFGCTVECSECLPYSRCFPTDWKLANVHHMFKATDHHLITGSIYVLIVFQSC